jgi:hypothetical protein
MTHKSRRMIVGTAMWLAAAHFAALAGCSSELSDVRGRVTMAGKPVTDAVIHFVPASGPESQARLDSNGSYRLATPGRGTGAAPGRYAVYLAPVESDAEEEAKESLSDQDYVAGKFPKRPALPRKSALPTKFLSMNTSGLTREVTRGSNGFDFELTDN